MEFQNPVKIYTAASNVEAHMVVQMLLSNDIPAHAIEDQSGVSLWAAGTISQFHQPDVWVNKSSEELAAQFIGRFEATNRERRDSDVPKGEILVECEECGKITVFPGKLDGTTQDCSHCSAFVDVGELPFTEEFDGAEG